MLKSRLKKVVSLFPRRVQEWIWSLWHFVSPPRIWIYDFEPQGCVFETPTYMESFRVSGLGDEKGFMLSVLQSLRPGDVFFDIGANLGLYSIHAAKRGAQVFAFEPDPAYRSRLMRNIKLNKLSAAVKVVDWAVSDAKGSFELFTEGVEGVSPSLIRVGERQSVLVEANSLDQAISTRELPFPTAIKIDIEGAEVLALKGMIGLLQSEKAPDYIFIEIHPLFLSKIGSSSDECKKILESAGYQEKSCETRNNQIHCAYQKS